MTFLSRTAQGTMGNQHYGRKNCFNRQSAQRAPPVPLRATEMATQVCVTVIQRVKKEYELEVESCQAPMDTDTRNSALDTLLTLFANWKKQARARCWAGTSQHTTVPGFQRKQIFPFCLRQLPLEARACQPASSMFVIQFPVVS